MVDYSKLRKKFPAKKSSRVAKAAKIKAIAREYELKKAELNGLKAPIMKKGLVFYAVVILGLLMLGSLVLSATGRGGRAPISRAQLNAEKSVRALALALGRYRYHVGVYPSTQEGLAILAAKNVSRKGWNGPYIRQVVLDPWGKEYVYACNGEGETPTLYSRGADGLAGTTDDVLPSVGLFDEPFRDTSWTKEWMPQHLRGYVLAPDAHTKKVLENEVRAVLTNATAQTIEIKPVPDDVLQRALSARIAGAEKDHAAVSWDSKKSAIQFLTHWNHDEESTNAVVVACLTRGDSADLYVNGEARGRAAASHARVEWRVPYEAGEVKVIAFANNVAIGEAAQRTVGEPVAVQLTSDVDALADGAFTFVLVQLVDDYQLAHPLAKSEFTCSVEGPGEILAMRPINAGRGFLAIRRTTGSGLPVKVRVKVKNFREAIITIPRKS